MRESLYSEILPNLWQGGTDDFDTVEFPRGSSFNRNDLGWESVATLYALANPMGWGIREQRFGFPDSTLESENLPHIHELAEWIHGEWKRGRKVLIRCQAGWNRSGLIAALVLRKEGYSAQEAIELIRQKRSPFALCNPAFVTYLRQDEALGQTH